MKDNLELLKDYQSFVGPKNNWNTIPRLIIKHLFNIGLSPETRLLDIGCGSLRTGRFLIPFLNTGNYYGIEPEKIMVEEGLKQELIPEIVKFKQPTFYFNKDFDVPDIKIDIAMAIQVFIHCGPEQLKQCLNMINKCLDINGIFLLSLNIADLDKLENKQGIHYAYRGASHAGAYYTKESIYQIFYDYGFSIENIFQYLWVAKRQLSSKRY
jgi:SAM-dependent methyltransferase